LVGGISRQTDLKCQSLNFSDSKTEKESGVLVFCSLTFKRCHQKKKKGKISFWFNYAAMLFSRSRFAS
jgi:hypothetical protein